MTDDQPAALDVSGLHLTIGDRTLLDAADFLVPLGRSAAIMGRSGSGKTSLLTAILGMAPVRSGTIVVCGEPVTGASPTETVQIRRRHIGMVFQDGQLLPELTPFENVYVAALLRGLPTGQATDAARRALATVEVDTVASTTQLSGGERQRVAVARAIVGEPELILADEPTGALDEGTRDVVADLMFGLPAQVGCAVVVVTHDAQVAARADHCFELTGGALRPRQVAAR